jgi:hypothetical protein
MTAKARAMPKISRTDRKLKAIVDGYDEVEVASIDSFPASDPPGWIEAKAHPCADGNASTEEECLEETAKTAKRAASR